MTDAFTPGRQLDDAALSSLPLFKDVPYDLLRTVLTEGVVHYYQDGEVMLHRDGPADHLILLLHGQTRIVTNGIFLVTRKSHEILGELAFINQATRNAAILAQGTVQALLLPAPLVERLMTNAAFTRNLLRLVAEKLDEATQERAFRFRNEALLFSEFRAHLSPEIAQRLLATGKQYGAPRFIEAVLLFADIRSFTEHSASMTPEHLVQELNPYLDTVVSVIHRFEGMVDKFIGDAVFALWGVTPGTADSIQQAFQCAQALLDACTQLSFGGVPLQLGIGLNAGRVFSGNVGSEGKRQFTVLGYPVNLAARCEQATKELHVPIVMSEQFADRLPPALFALLQKHDHVALKGTGWHTLYTYDPATT